MKKRGFTLVEILVVIGILGLLFTIVTASLKRADAKGRATRGISELKAIATAVELYLNDFGSYPADVDRAMPPGIESYLAPGNWPIGPWLGSVYDWDNWNNEQVVQITLRMCPITGVCSPPFKNWTRYSSMYYCIQGACVPHVDHPTDPGWCVNCTGTSMPDLK